MDTTSLSFEDGAARRSVVAAIRKTTARISIK